MSFPFPESTEVCVASTVSMEVIMSFPFLLNPQGLYVVSTVSMEVLPTVEATHTSVDSGNGKLTLLPYLQ